MGQTQNLSSEESAGEDLPAVQAELDRRTALLRAIGFAATHIIAVNDWRTGIQELLDRLGQAAGVSRVSLFEVHLGPEGRLVESIRYDWAEPGLAKLAGDERYQNMPMSDEDRSGNLGEWARRRAQGEVVQATLREVRGYTREVFLEHGTLSFASVPIIVGDLFSGILGFDDCKTERIWTPLELEVLQTAAALIAGAIGRARTNEELRRSEERYQMAARGANDGLWDWDVIDDRAYFSPRLYQILGLGDGALGDNMSMLIGSFDADDEDRVRGLFRTCFEQQEQRFRFEARLREPVADRRWLVARGLIVYAAGRPARVVGSVRDITDFKRAEEKLRTLSDDAPVLLCMIDREDRLIFANRGFLSFFGRTLDDMADGRWDWTKDIHPDDLPETRQRYFDALRRHASVEMEHRVRRFDGEYRWVHETQVARFTPEGTFAGFVGALVDITDRKHAESERMRLQTQLADADRQRAVLARHFSPNMVEELMRSGGQLDAVRTQPITVLFADLFNFTAMSATTPMTEVIELLRRFHTLVEDAVFGNNGTLDKYIGDGVMATFGTPFPGARDATNAVACARDLVRDLNRWNREREAAGLCPLRIGVGLHCGEATIGNVGSARRFEHTVVGEIVNLASRIENLTRTLDIAILISNAIIEEVKREAGHAVLTGFDQLGAQSIRGYQKRIGLWGLTAVAIGVD
jgi:PAS domain S-box-containing protein